MHPGPHKPWLPGRRCWITWGFLTWHGRCTSKSAPDARRTRVRPDTGLSEGKGVHGGVPRLGSIDAVRTVAGLLGLITPNTMGAFTRVLLPVAVVAMRVRVIPGRRLT